MKTEAVATPQRGAAVMDEEQWASLDTRGIVLTI
ncbi:unnamed protein product [Callosobruchus maculatus]|uniref:Uncharacterized protein n=1 Tax=Callosobruchus maculatus TaxID=64391 RepID=A0A653D679_CALMS|nr:unnamed protein product [Callosobruchus maculatus]